MRLFNTGFWKKNNLNINKIIKIVEFMQLGNSTDGTDLKKNIRQLDTRRNESLKVVAPRLAEILKYDESEIIRN
jgi:hypothetical protein